MTQIKNAAVLFVGLVLTAGCSEILTDYSFYTPDASDDGGQQVSDAGQPIDAGSPDDGGPEDAGTDAGTDGGPCGASGCLPWARAFGSTGHDQVLGMAVDPAGNVYLTGSFGETVSFGGDVALTAVGQDDVFVASYTSTGEFRWARSGGGDGVDYGYGIAVDGGGNVYVTGRFTGTASFGGAELTSLGFEDLFVASYSSAGVHRWSLRGGGDGVDEGYGIATDASGNVYVAGTFSSTASFGAPTSVTAEGPADILVVSYASTGAHRWTRRSGGSGADLGDGIAVDSAANVYVTGRFSGTASIAGPSLTSQGGQDVFVASYSGATGSPQWSQRGGGTGDDRGNAIAVHPGGDIYVTGYFGSMGSFGGPALTSAGLHDLFAASYTSTGVHRWSMGGGGDGQDRGHGIAIDGSGAVHIAGEHGGMAAFGGSMLSSAGGADMLHASYAESDGAHRASVGFGGSEDDLGLAVAAGGGVVCVGGSFTETITIAGQTFIAVHGADAFVACFAP